MYRAVCANTIANIHDCNRYFLKGIGGRFMFIEKEVIRPGQYFYRDEATGLPRKLVVTPELTKYWCEQGNAMLSAGLTVPVPCEHDFNAHPMTPADKLLNNAGWVKEYRLSDGKGGSGDRLFSVVDIQDEEVGKKLPGTIRWTSPWINSFTDGKGKEWKNVISHLALTTRPRIIEQAPFGNTTAALSMATEVEVAKGTALPKEGMCLSRAGRLFTGKKSKRLRARYPIAFSLWAGGIALAEGDLPPPKKKKPGTPGTNGTADDDADDTFEDDFDGDLPDDEMDVAPDADLLGDGLPPAPEPGAGIPPAMADPNSDIGMEELLCDLLQSLGVPMPNESNPEQFKRHLYEATMSKIKELTSKGMGKQEDEANKPPDQNQPPNQQPNASQPNPLIQQEQQPMFMSLSDINKLPDPMKGVALAMYAENQKLRAEMEASKKTTDSLRDAKLQEFKKQRDGRIAILGRLSPRLKVDLDAMVAQPSMALSMGDGGAVNDPMATTLAMLEKGLSDMPRLLTADHTALSVAAQPTDGDMLSEERADIIADDMARKMGCPPQQKKAG